MKYWFELKYSLRSFKKSPMHNALCVFVIALGVGIALLAFTISYNALLKPLSFKESNRWVYISLYDTVEGLNWTGDTVDRFLYQELQENTDLFEEFGAIRLYGYSRLANNVETIRITSADITPRLFIAAGMKAYLGRTLLPDDSEPGSQRTTVISYTLWKNHFASDPDIIGQTINLDETPHEIVGVMEEGTGFGVLHDLWLPMTQMRSDSPTSQGQLMAPVGLLKNGVTVDDVNVQLNAIRTRLSDIFPKAYDSAQKINAIPLHRLGTENDTPIFLAICLLTFTILLLSCLNIGNLILAKVAESEREQAIRKTLGSSPWRQFRYSLINSLPTCLLGIAIGILISVIGLEAIDRYATASTQINRFAGLPNHWDLGFSADLVFISFAIFCLIWLLAGLLPLWKQRRADISTILNSGAKGGSGLSKLNLIRCLVGFEVISSCFLLIVSGALLFSIKELVNTDYGVIQANRHIIEMELPRNYQQDISARNTLFANLLVEIEADSIVNSASFTTGLPNDIGRTTYALPDRDVRINEQFPGVRVASISNNYLSLVDVSILEGRGFDANGTPDTPFSILIDNQMANKLWPNESPIGKQINIPANSDNLATVVGVTENVVPRVFFTNRSQESIVYASIQQFARGRIMIVAESNVDNESVFLAIKSAVNSIDHGIAVYSPRTMEDHLIVQSSGMIILGNFFIAISIATMILAAIGILAIIARTVVQQTRDIGVRRAIGSSNFRVVKIYLYQCLWYLGVGIVIGGSLAVIVNNALSGFFNNIMQYTPFVALLVTLLLILVLLVACLAPCRKAISLEPGDALRYE